jgi:hypothetical protein
MKNVIMVVLPLAILAGVASQGAAETLIPRSVPGDKGQYFLVEAKKSGDIITTLHKRVGVDSVGWTKCEINCKARLIRDIGYSEDGPKTIKANPTKWYELVEGSSKSDLFNFVCSNH